MSPEEHRRWEEELAAYVLGVLPDNEQDVVERHLAGCERCQADLRWLQSAVEVLPATVEPRRPPARLRRNILATVRAEADARAGGTQQAVPRVRSVSILRPALALGATAAVVIGGVAGYLARGPEAVGPQSSESARVIARATGEAPPLAEATLTLTGDSGVLVTSGLSQPRRGVYQVWVRDGETISPSTVFVIDRGGAGIAAIQSGLDGADEVMVTLEPPGGSEAPTTAPLLRAPL